MKTSSQLICVSAAMALVLIVAAQVQADDAPAAPGEPCVTRPPAAAARSRVQVEQEAAQAVKEYRATLSRDQDQLRNPAR